MQNIICITLAVVSAVLISPLTASAEIGREVSIPDHLQDGEEYSVPLSELLRHGENLFKANWTSQEGGGRPLTKGMGMPLSDLDNVLVFPRNFNRVSAPDANSCAGCHNSPWSGGNGDIVANVFVLGQRFDFATFDMLNETPSGGARDENGEEVTLQTIANSRATLGMFGSGFIEMLARQMTVELQTIRNTLQPSQSAALVTKDVSFGTLARLSDGTWDTSQVDGIAAPSLVSTSADLPPSLVIRPFHQVGNVVSIRQFSNNAFNHHHGIQTAERFGKDTDPDGDGFRNEMTRADVTAVSIFQAVMAVPGRIIPNDSEIEAAVLNGEERFTAIGCASCHTPFLPLENEGWIFSEPNPFNPTGNLKVDDALAYSVDLTSDKLPTPRLRPVNSIVYVPAFTDLKLHDITDGDGDPNIEALDMNQPAGSLEFFSENSKFLTRKLWGVASKPNFFHHGQFTTMRQAILAHGGEATESRDAFNALDDYGRNSLIEFLKTLRNLPAGTTDLFVDENGQPKQWPPARFQSITQIEDRKLLLKWAGNSGLYAPPKRFQVQTRSDLGTPDWSNLGTPTLENRKEVEVEGKAGFFRIQSAN